MASLARNRFSLPLRMMTEFFRHAEVSSFETANELIDHGAMTQSSGATAGWIIGRPESRQQPCLQASAGKTYGTPASPAKESPASKALQMAAEPAAPAAGPGERRSPRIVAPVPILVTGSDASGVLFNEETVTVSISKNGCRISLIHSLLPDDILLIKNKENQREQEFRVIGGLHEVIGARREWGLEALNPAGGFWGERLARVPEEIEPRALIECAACHAISFSPLSHVEYDVLVSVGMISRHCERCGETTRWKPSPPASAEIQTAAAGQPSSPQIENRNKRRLMLTLRLHVRNASGVSDVVETRDVSKSGLCFASSKQYEVGEELSIASLSPSNKPESKETKGKIIWATERSGSWIYGVAIPR